jgi:hypothetical protein
VNRNHNADLLGIAGHVAAAAAPYYAGFGLGLRGFGSAIASNAL